MVFASNITDKVAPYKLSNLTIPCEVRFTYRILGLHVIATARRPEVLAELADLGISTVALDVTDLESIKRCHEEVAKINGGKLDILVNNA